MSNIDHLNKTKGFRVKVSKSIPKDREGFDGEIRVIVRDGVWLYFKYGNSWYKASSQSTKVSGRGGNTPVTMSGQSGNTATHINSRNNRLEMSNNINLGYNTLSTNGGNKGITFDRNELLKIEPISGTTKFTSEVDGSPVLWLENTNSNTRGPGLIFNKNKGAAGADGDDIGTIKFTSDNSAQEQIIFAKIVAEISEADDTDEAGKLSFYVAESDGSSHQLTAGLVLEGEHATDGEVDVTIGAGTNSSTTVAGRLLVIGTLTGDSITCSAVTQSSTVDNDPISIIRNTHDGPRGGQIHFIKNRGAAGQDDDNIGRIKFQSYNDAGTPESIDYGLIEGNISDASDGVEGGKLKFSVASHDGEMAEGLTIEDGSEEDQVDVTVNNGLLTINRDVTNTTAGTYRAINIDYDKTGASTSNNTLTGMLVNVTNLSATNGTNTAYGILSTCYLSHAVDAGISNAVGGHFRAIGGTNGAGNATGIQVVSSGADVNKGITINCTNGGNSLEAQSSTNVLDYFAIQVNANGATAIGTTDADNDLAHLTIAPDGNLTLTCTPGGKISIMENDLSTFTPAHADDVTTKSYVDAGDAIKVVKVTISEAEMNALHTTEAELVPAQGVGKVIIPISVLLFVDRDASTAQSANANLYIGINGSTTTYNGSWGCSVLCF